MSYQRFVLFSEKNAALGEYHGHDGTCAINLDEIKDEIDGHLLCIGDESYINYLLDTIIHEDTHKFISESIDDQETFNEQDERIFMVIRDWVHYGKLTSIIGYD